MDANFILSKHINTDTSTVSLPFSLSLLEGRLSFGSDRICPIMTDTTICQHRESWQKRERGSRPIIHTAVHIPHNYGW